MVITSLTFKKLKLFLIIVICIFEVEANNDTTEDNIPTPGSTASLHEAIEDIGRLFNRPVNELTSMTNMPAILLSTLITSPTVSGTNVNAELEAVKASLGTTFTANGVSSACQSDVFDIVDGFSSGELWALQILDSYGKPGADMLQGNIRWLGNYQECLDFYVTPVNMHLEHVNPTAFEAKYCRVSMPAERFLPAHFKRFIKDEMFHDEVTVGSCLPQSCSLADVTGLVMATQTLLNVSEPLTPTVYCVENKELGTGAVVGICVLAVIGSLMLIGTLYDIIIVHMRLVGNRSMKKYTVNRGEGRLDTHAVNKEDVKENGHHLHTGEQQKHDGNNAQDADVKNDTFKHSFQTPDSRNDVTSGREDIRVGNGGSGKTAIEYVNEAYDGEHINGLSTSSAAPESVYNPKETSDNVNVETSHEVNEKARTTPKLKNDKGILARLVLSFSVYTNGQKLLSSHQSEGSITSVHGIRFLSMGWVILGHTILLTPQFSSNAYSYGSIGGVVLGRWTFLIIANAFLSVDTFFTLSGLLVAFLALKELDKRGGARKLNWAMFYFLRFWRLTPAYMLVLMVAFVIFPLVIEGPMQGMNTLMRNCDKTWWTNLLYVNNLVGDKAEEIDGVCMGWSWYLANDMQFYILSPLMIVPLFYNMYAGIVSCLVFLAVTTGLSAYITYTHEYLAQLYSPFLPTEKDPYYFSNLYIPCYTRMGPYIVGVFTGYLLYKWKCECQINKVVNAILWLLAVAVCSTIVFSVYNKWDSHIFTVVEATIYRALSRTGWGVGVSWIVFACATGNGGWINDLLSWDPFVPLGRLTYCAYLIHPVMMWAYYEQLPQQFMFSDWTLPYLFIGHVVVAYGSGFIISLAFESPMMGLGKVLFQGK